MGLISQLFISFRGCRGGIAECIRHFLWNNPRYSEPLYKPACSLGTPNHRLRGWVLGLLYFYKNLLLAFFLLGNKTGLKEFPLVGELSQRSYQHKRFGYKKRGVGKPWLFTVRAMPMPSSSSEGLRGFYY